MLHEQYIPVRKYLSMTRSLTRTLDWVQGHLLQTGDAPKISQVANGLGIQRETVIERLVRLEKMGKVMRVHGRIIPCSPI